MADNAKIIWGKIILMLRENKHIALHIACGNIVDVEIENNEFVINISENGLIDIIKENIELLHNYIKELGKNYTIKLIERKNIEVQQKEDIEKLEKYLKEYLTIRSKNE